MNAPANFKLPTPSRERLVVIGNGMAGCRAVEEVLARDPDRYAITIFGAEPRVNYNRIMLSPVLAILLALSILRWPELRVLTG